MAFLHTKDLREALAEVTGSSVMKFERPIKLMDQFLCCRMGACLLRALLVASTLEEQHTVVNCLDKLLEVEERWVRSSGSTCF